MATIFYLAALVILYVYVGYPAILAVWVKLAPRRVRSAAITPSVSIMVAARNEGATLEARIANLLSLDYPRELVQVVVASDGSTDSTDAVLDRYADRVDVVRVPAGGKARALNAAVALARHDILVFADARQSFAPDALRALVAPFADPAIGCVSGELVLDCEVDGQSSAMGDGVGFYWKYEKWLRRHESTVASMLGVTGAIYALRRRLWRRLPPETILDDVLTPMRVALAGFRVVFEPRARAFDRVVGAARDEFRRKTRTLAGNFQLLAIEPRLLLPIANPLWFQFLSHKVGRLVVPYALCLLLLSSALLAGQSAIYTVAFAGQLVFYSLALYGAVLHRREHLLTPRPSASGV
jgi:cellulose synthase/poly-beta-1,6-N-acetylglucosamine synthase-like glycosyltransferase